MNNFFVYKLIDPLDKLPFYVGCGQGSRAKSYWKIDPRITKATRVVIDAIKLRGHEIEVEIVKDHLDEFDANVLEVELIKKHGRRTRDVGGILTNASRDSILAKPGSKVGYSTIQVPIVIKQYINEYCRKRGMKIGRFIEGLVLKEISGSIDFNAFSAELLNTDERTRIPNGGQQINTTELNSLFQTVSGTVN